MKPLYIDIHVLQTVPPSNINRDDTGSPKTAWFGGVKRARVSSQAWKAACRKAFPELVDVDRLGTRTKNLVDFVASMVMELHDDVLEDDARKAAADVLKAAKVNVDKDGKSGALFFMSPMQAKKLAELAYCALESGEKASPIEAKAVLNVKENPSLNAIDIALFGRMVADAPDLNVDAAVQVAHAIGVSKAQTEFDYYTAMDDRSPEDSAGAGMIGTIEFMSSTLYRYATIDMRHLLKNLGDEKVAIEAMRAFISAFVTSMPSGKQNTFANRTLPGVVLVELKETQPVSLVNAFESPIHPQDNRSVMNVALEKMLDQRADLENAFGAASEKAYMVVASSDAKVPAALVDMVKPFPAVLDSIAEDVASKYSKGDE